MQLILADNQAIYCTGIARILMTEVTMRVVALCIDPEQLRNAITTLPKSVVLFPSSIANDLHELLDQVQQAGSRAVMILEPGVTLDDSIAKRLEGILLRSVAAPQLVECIYRVAAGERYQQRAIIKTLPIVDRAGAKAALRLTPRELQIVALISEGRKNKEIATQLGTKEQVVKNYLRRIYGKTGVSDRLELALFTVHHHALAEVVEITRQALVRTA